MPDGSFDGVVMVGVEPDYIAAFRDRASLGRRDVVAVHRADGLFLGAKVGGSLDGMGRSLEALVRWQHPQRGLVGPMECIEVAESMGLIQALGQQVADKVCVQIRAWEAEGLGCDEVQGYYISRPLPAAAGRLLRGGSLFRALRQMA